LDPTKADYTPMTRGITGTVQQRSYSTSDLLQNRNRSSSNKQIKRWLDKGSVDGSLKSVD